MPFYRFITWILSLLWSAVTGIRNLLYDIQFFKSETAFIPTLVIGNLSMGGTGKSPMIKFLLSHLGDKKVAVLSRGYKRKSKGLLFVEENTPSLLCGDEPLDLKRSFSSVPVVVCENRILGCKRIHENYPDTELILLDDGFQHRRLIPTASVLLFNYDAFLDDSLHVFPLGKLRESMNSIKRTQAIVITKCPAVFDKSLVIDKLKYANAPIFFSKIVYENFIQHFYHQEEKISLKQLPEYQITCLSSIANPEPMQAFLNSHTNKISYYIFQDHHAYQKKELDEMEKKYRLTHSNKNILLGTSKDAAKINELLADRPDFPFYILNIKMEFIEENDTFAFLKTIREYVG